MEMNNTHTDLKKYYPWVLLGVGILSLVALLGMAFFHTKGEPREAVVALSMLNSGDWISPVNNGVDIAYKPPFFHWCVAIASWVLGGVSEFSSRLPSAVATIAMTLVAWNAMRRNGVDTRINMLTGLLTLSTFEVHRAAMACRVDMLLSALIVIAVYMLHSWHTTRRRSYILWAVAAMSGAVLTKGPVGALLPLGIIGAYRLVKGYGFFKTVGLCMLLLISSLVLPFIWYYMAYLERGDAFLYLVFEENILRFTGKMVYASHEASAFYNVVSLATGFLPYTLLLLMVLLSRRYRWHCRFSAFSWRKCGCWSDILWKRIRQMSSQDLLSLLSVAVIFVFYCIPKSKRSVYLLPLYPFLAYYLARFLMWLSSTRRRFVVVYGWTLVGVLALLVLLMVVIKAGLVPATLFNGKHAMENQLYLESLEQIHWFLVLLPLAITILLVWGFRKWSSEGNFTLSAAVTFIVLSVYFVLDATVLPCVYDVKSDYSVARQIAHLVPRGKIWDYRKDFRPGERNRMHQFTVNFYLGDRIQPLDLEMPSNGYMIMGDDDLETFHSSHPSYRLTPIQRFDHRSCDDKRQLTLYKFVKD